MPSRLRDLLSDQHSRHAIALATMGVIAAIIAVLALTPRPPPGLSLGWDKLNHFVAFGALVFPCALFYARSLVWILPAAVLYGGAIELIQPFVGRDRDVRDLLADVLGVLIAAGVGLLVRWVFSRRGA